MRFFVKSKRIDWKKHARRRLFDKHEKYCFALIDWIVMAAITVCYAAVAFINLGSTDIPKTFYTFDKDDVIVEFSKQQQIFSIRYYASVPNNFDKYFDFSLQYSPDGEGYTEIEFFKEDEDKTSYTEPGIKHEDTNLYKWQIAEISPFTAKYVSFHVGGRLPILEIGFCDKDGNPVEVVSAVSANPQAPRGNSPVFMFDEQQHVPQQTYYMNEMYFDEVHHARTAYEHINYMNPREFSHPPLGKILLGVGIRIFGMNPFGWRFMGTLFGVLMLPLMYIFAKRLFRNTLYAAIPTVLFASDFMHYTQTRIATIDSYSVFFIMLMCYFMYLYTETNYNRQPLKKSLVPLALCGITFGLGAATKWLCIYAGAGLALIFAIQMVKRYREYAYAKNAVAAHDNNNLKRRQFLEEVSRNYLKKTFITLLWCVLFFIIIPLIIYLISYIPYTLVKEGAYDFNAILHNQEVMFNHHSKFYEHPYSSPWYSWPLNIKPVFLFQGKGYPDELMSSMSTMGNPAVWWAGLASVIALIVIRICKGRLGRRVFFLSVMALSQYVPWALLSRETYIYHYFATVPFLILLIGVLAKYIIEHTKHGKKAVFVFVGICVMLFIMFYPVTTGIVIPRAYSNTFLKWFQSWPFH